MEPSARIFNCARCQQQTLICSCCDHGNVYCSAECSAIARQENIKASNRRYQQSFTGRMHHAARQRRYRQRRSSKNIATHIAKVTDHSSSPVASNDVLPSVQEKRMDHAPTSVTEQHRCFFCGCSCSVFLRQGFLRSASCTFKYINRSWPQGP